MSKELEEQSLQSVKASRPHMNGPRGIRQKNLQNLDTIQLEGRLVRIGPSHLKGFLYLNLFKFLIVDKHMMSKSILPGFAAEVTLYRNNRQYLSNQAVDGSRSSEELLLQARVNETFVITPTDCCYCYEDTDRLQSVCECGLC